MKQKRQLELDLNLDKPNRHCKSCLIIIDKSKQYCSSCKSYRVLYYVTKPKYCNRCNFPTKKGKMFCKYCNEETVKSKIWIRKNNGGRRLVRKGFIKFPPLKRGGGLIT